MVLQRPLKRKSQGRGSLLKLALASKPVVWLGLNQKMGPKRVTKTTKSPANLTTRSQGFIDCFEERIV
ncbi:hypothetical protein PSHT_07099 [Puccinia striiformis]|uniref:Uncharacterized protein n=1 Tax=Puccinia striiformis TaxID=27350 RepID=A0A2S4W0U8_9BASI|nr:hypothetical protein PSHT_07099 [Puccinia striiformis]